MLKCTFSGLQRYRWQYWSIFIRLAVVASQNHTKFWQNLTVQQFKVIDHGLLVSIECSCANSYYSLIVTLAVCAAVNFRDIILMQKIADFPDRSLLWCCSSYMKLKLQKLEGWDYCIMTVVWSYLQPFLHDPPTWQRDRRTDKRMDGR